MVAVVVVEDDALVGGALRRQLREVLHVSARVILDPMQAEAALAEERPQVVISDLNMPRRNGVEVLAMAREKFPSIRRCLLSGSLSQLRDEDLSRIEPCVLLHKPWSIDDLTQLLA